MDTTRLYQTWLTKRDEYKRLVSMNKPHEFKWDTNLAELTRQLRELEEAMVWKPGELRAKLAAIQVS